MSELSERLHNPKDDKSPRERNYEDINDEKAIFEEKGIRIVGEKWFTSHQQQQQLRKKDLELYIKQDLRGCVGKRRLKKLRGKGIDLCEMAYASPEVALDYVNKAVLANSYNPKEDQNPSQLLLRYFSIEELSHIAEILQRYRNVKNAFFTQNSSDTLKPSSNIC